MRMGSMRYIGGVSLSLLIVGVSWAQDTSQNAPLLNAFGRFWGIGYSQGYHRCDDGRLGWGLARDFLTSPTPNSALTAIYTTPYQQLNSPRQFNQVAWPNGATVGVNQGNFAPVVSQQVPKVPLTGENVSKKPLLPNLPNKQTSIDGQKSPSDRPITPPRPTSPPPAWLKRYLAPDEVGGAVLSDSIQSLEQAPPAKTTTPVETKKPDSADDDLLVPQASPDDLLSPRTSSRITRPAPIYYVPNTRKPTPKTAGMPSNVWLGPVSSEMQSQRR